MKLHFTNPFTIYFLQNNLALFFFFLTLYDLTELIFLNQVLTQSFVPVKWFILLLKQLYMFIVYFILKYNTAIYMAHGSFINLFFI